MQLADDLGRGTARGRVLALLATTPALELHTRELIRRVQGTPRPVQIALESLEREGLLKSRRVGGLRLWSVSTAHPLYEPIRQIAERTVGLAPRLRMELAGTQGIEVAFIFGSFAAGSTDAESDVDVFVLGAPDWRAVAKVTRKLGSIFGREVNLIAWTRDEIRRALADRSPFLETLRRDPKIWLIGDEDGFGRILGALEEEVLERRAGGKAQPGRRRAKAAARGKEPRPSETQSRGGSRRSAHQR